MFISVGQTVIHPRSVFTHHSQEHFCSFSSKLFNPLPKRKILDSPKLKVFADDNFKFDENGRKLSKWVEKTVAKGEIAPFEQFLLFLLCFQKTYTADT